MRSSWNITGPGVCGSLVPGGPRPSWTYVCSRPVPMGSSPNQMVTFSGNPPPREWERDPTKDLSALELAVIGFLEELDPAACLSVVDLFPWEEAPAGSFAVALPQEDEGPVGRERDDPWLELRCAPCPTIDLFLWEEAPIREGRTSSPRLEPEQSLSCPLWSSLLLVWLW